MGKAVVKFTVHSPKKTYTTTQYVEGLEKFTTELKENIAEATVSQLYTVVEERKIDTVLMYATFFQRVVARTPLDEKYLNYTTKEGRKVYHIPNEDRCKLDWYIESGEKRITSEELMDQGFTFKQIDNKAEIDKLVTILDKFLSFSDRGVLHAEIGNENKHFTVLEYGGGYNWTQDTEPRTGIKQQPYDNGYKHGVQNLHSVQAPVGMMRVTQAELVSNTKRRKTRNEYTIGHKRGMRRDFSKSDLDKMVKILEKGTLKYSDIQYYMNNYK